MVWVSGSWDLIRDRSECVGLALASELNRWYAGVVDEVVDEVCLSDDSFVDVLKENDKFLGLARVRHSS